MVSKHDTFNLTVCLLLVLYFTTLTQRCNQTNLLSSCLICDGRNIWPSSSSERVLPHRPVSTPTTAVYTTEGRSDNDWQRSVTGPDWEKERYKFCCSDWLYFYYCVQSEGSTRLTKLRLVLNKYKSSFCYCTAFFLPYKFSQQFILLFSCDRSHWLGQHFFLLHNEPRSLVLAHVRGTGCPEAFWSMPVSWKLRVMRLIHMCKLVRQCQAERLQPDRSQHQRSRVILHKLNPLLLLNHYEPHRQILNQLTSDMADRQWTTLTVIITLINLSGCWSVLHHRATSQPSHF